MNRRWWWRCSSRVASVGRITPLGYNFVDASGQIVRRKSITAFTLPKHAAAARYDDARRYLDYVAGKRLNEVRVFASVDWTGPPGKGVESGWTYDESACSWVLEQAADRGLRVEVVALTYAGSLADMVERVRRADELCLAHENALFEVANEPGVNGIDVAAVLREYTPRTPGWASGAYEPTPDPRGPALTYHSPRKYEWSRCFKDAYEFQTGQGPTQQFSPGYTGPVMLDEPPQVEQTIRDATATAVATDDWRAYGAGAALFACGATMHSNPTLQKCEVPTDPMVDACIDAFVAGFDDVPIQRYHGYNRGDPPGTDPGSRRYNRWGDDGKMYEICVRPYSFRRVA